MRGELFASKATLETMQRWNRIFFPFQYGYGLMRFKTPRFLSPFNYSPELIGHSGSTGSFLYYCKDLDFYMAGTINQMALKSAPFRLMLRVAEIFKGTRLNV
jgi:CubicO group peptidase (beta-lactamase class C family)